MASNPSAKGSKSGRSKKSPAMARYKAANRKEVNAKKKQARHARKVKDDVVRVRDMKVKRGTSRALRRRHLKRKSVQSAAA